jgi:hypothetical protein
MADEFAAAIFTVEVEDTLTITALQVVTTKYQGLSEYENNLG